MVDRISCSLCRDLDLDTSADFTAKTSPEMLETAREMVAEEPCPTVQRLVHHPISPGRCSKVGALFDVYGFGVKLSLLALPFIHTQIRREKIVEFF